MLPDNVLARIEKDSYPVPPVFSLLQKKGDLAEKMMYNTFNMGIGMVLAVDAADADKTLAALEAAGEKAYRIGRIEAGQKGVELC
jgi:phosphoribosylformylglycinamidine cyclo-ligase